MTKWTWSIFCLEQSMRNGNITVMMQSNSLRGKQEVWIIWVQLTSPVCIHTWLRPAVFVQYGQQLCWLLTVPWNFSGNLRRAIRTGTRTLWTRSGGELGKKLSFWSTERICALKHQWVGKTALPPHLSATSDYFNKARLLHTCSFVPFASELHYPHPNSCARTCVVLTCTLCYFYHEDCH